MKWDDRTWDDSPAAAILTFRGSKRSCSQWQRIGVMLTNLRGSYSLEVTALTLTKPVLTTEMRLWGD
jgi:hypothetical protein